MKLLKSLLLLTFFLGVALASSNKRTLVLLSNVSSKDNYSKYFKSLKDLGYSLDIRGHLDKTLKLEEYGTYNYNNLILFTPEAEAFGGSINLESIIGFVDAGNNVVLAASPSSSPLIRKLSSELGIELKDKETRVYDYFNTVNLDDNSEDPSRIYSSEFVKSNLILGNEPLNPVLYSGTAATILSNSELAVVALSAAPTAFSQKHDAIEVVGRANALVAVVQMRNNARALVSGSLDLFSNAYFSTLVPSSFDRTALVPSGNRAFCAAVTNWVFQGAGVLRLGLARHRILPSSETVDGLGNSDAASRNAGEESPATYVVGQEVEFTVEIFKKESATTPSTDDKSIDVLDENRYVPVVDRLEGLQLEYTMLSPFIRLPLEPRGDGTFFLRFKVPDVYGVFKYEIAYNRVGLSRLQLQLQVPVRPYKHDEYERFLTCAGPYYASAASSIVAFLALGWAFLYHK
uniref:Dolichyl-diphosphooligosaccharide--protein glycosyltransferase 48 kDa subunit n=2 Tax=Polytomella parva TaxID=51329 RepID=A0A7S0YD16_9CHLO|mmetsp:Transcript_10313/g.19034  ORF Transcript_10313/g.19034 Transcript_10313/m.19034 type:complete len:460 (+) Transcript_10313:123-1502(+)